MESPSGLPGEDRLLAFYRGAGTDSEGRTIDEILAWDDRRLEMCHDFIQWLFPSDEPSAVNPDAPLLDAGRVAAFAGEPGLRRNLLRSFERMLRFYGLTLAGPERKRRVDRSDAWEARSGNWLTRGNHNHLRITRILRSLNLLGLPAYAAAFYAFLDALARDDGGAAISDVTLEYWRSAADAPQRG